MCRAVLMYKVYNRWARTTGSRIAEYSCRVGSRLACSQCVGELSFVTAVPVVSWNLPGNSDSWVTVSDAAP